MSNLKDYLNSKKLKEDEATWGCRFNGKDILFESLIGKTILEVKQLDGNDALAFEFDDSVVLMHHHGDCCESVEISDICGDLNDLIGNPLLLVEESTNSEEDPPECSDSFTWTFYKLATIKGYVDIRWLGESNGYYSESVDITQYMKQ